jgi:DtxR family transcriptional regulator, Mn-dependent transcriptional regulator
MAGQESKEEILEMVWVLNEKNDSSRQRLARQMQLSDFNSIITEMIAEGLLQEKWQEIHFTREGAKRAAKIIRAHRLAERLFHDVLELNEESMESNACTFEHILNPEVTDAICTLLGHPPECPHGKPIPRGNCCKKQTKEVEQIIYPLTKAKAGETVKIKYITLKQTSDYRKLMSFGIFPGKVIKVRQMRPACVLKIDETEIAIDGQICAGVHVRHYPVSGER